MTKATLEFDLPDDQGDFNAALRGRDALLILWEIDARLRSLLKHGEPTEAEEKLAEEIRNMIPFHLLDE
ncbi:MAG: hypothetical protein EBZ69_00205 [Alphaproteobacteria bacterium]|nr:hypothetical protein [Alphaproteobacteria bacterium]